VGSAYDSFVKDLLQFDGEVAIKLVNAVFWDDDRINPHESFMDKMKMGFQADDFSLDFAKSDALTVINNWVDEQTSGKIIKIMDEIREDEALFLINALYFQGDWANPFVPAASRKDQFTKSDGTTKEVVFMYQDVNDLRSFQDEKLQVVEKTFADTNYSLVLIQSADDMGIDEVITQTGAARLNDLLSKDLYTGRILLYLPKFEVTYEQEMSSVLKLMGMEQAFSPGMADFANLGTAAGNIFLTKVKHKTFLSIDEKGAEGAAVTSIGVGVTSLPPAFRYNKPFIYLLRNRSTGVFLFTGKMEDPS